MIVTQTANELIVKWLEKGISYAAAQQKVADELMEEESKVFSSPNNLLGIEYLKALTLYNSDVKPMTVTRTGGEHDGDTGYSASRLRKIICSGGPPWDDMPKASAEICKREIEQSRGPVSVKKHFEIALLSRLRMLSELDFLSVPDATEGLDKRMARYAHSEPTIDAMLEKIKTKRYAMSRIRRMLMCAALGITANDTVEPPAYIRVLAINEMGMDILSKAREKAKLPIITKPASIQKMKGRAVEMFYKEAAITDFYSLAFNSEQHRIGGNEWRQTPIILV
jgi:predicted nucleotidyltransferase